MKGFVGGIGRGSLIVAAMVVCAGSLVSLQTQGQNRKNPPAAKAKTTSLVALRKALKLTDAQYAKFLPFYQQMEETIAARRKERADLIWEYEHKRYTLPVSTLADRLNVLLIQELLAVKEFHRQVVDALPPEKIVEFYIYQNKQKKQ